MINLLRHSAIIQSLGTSQTATGTYNPTYSTRIASLQCLVQGKSLKSTDEFGKVSLENVYKLYCMYNSTNSAIAESDRVVWQSRTFEITGIKDGGGQARHFEIDMLEVK